jgi:chaperonin cofactor prefoldin
MQDFDGQNIKVDVNILEENIELLIARLNECRKENDVLRSELSSLQNILRSCKLPGSVGSAVMEAGGSSEGVFTYAEQMQVKHKLVMILQKIEMELRNNQTL